ncbi:uncharacterized protein LOC106872842 [Octopus bimaculoides]|uniref:uncharacterized protein LOC106872842 n=1 Tax=Octopus bimaculoides TaxID=37653 RepID=UPI00071D2DD1|nr:uncharacterized protein LOC106872842 [Octopus bimaculoides]|eukprot:XP_014775462.1 PREDICTED: uncharacterized protein LOC106872842 isoform X2 [Octopus bimaculoides]
MTMEIQIFIFCALFTVCYGSQCEKVYKIFVKGRVVLQRNITLQTEEMPNMQRPVVWQNGDRKFECDQTCYKYGRYEVWQFGNISTLLIKNMSDYDLSWTFNDNKPCYARVSLKKEGKEITSANNNNNNSF